MPNYKQVDFKKTIMYKIISPNNKKVYYGSTVRPIQKRFDSHINDRNCLSREIIDSGDAVIIEIEKYPCSSLEELEDREAFYILNDWDGCVNQYVPGSYRRAGGVKAYGKYYKENNKEKVSEWQKKYADKNRTKLRKKANEKIVCSVCGCMIARAGKSTHQKSKTCQKYLKNELDNLMNDMITQLE